MDSKRHLLEFSTFFSSYCRTGIMFPKFPAPSPSLLPSAPHPSKNKGPLLTINVLALKGIV